MINKNLKLGVGIFLLGVIMAAGTACSQKDQDIVKKHATNAVNELTSEEKTEENKDIENKGTNNTTKVTQYNTDKKTQNPKKVNNVTVTKNLQQTNKNYAKEYLKIIEESTKYQSDVKYDLIYFNNDDIPDLVIGKQDTFLNIYVYDDVNFSKEKSDHEGMIKSFVPDGCKVIPLEHIDEGIPSNSFTYNYIEKNGILINYNTEFAGHVLTTGFYIFDGKSFANSLLKTELGADITKNDPDYEQVKNALDSYGGCKFYGPDSQEQKISEEEYKQKFKAFGINPDRGKDKSLTPTKSVNEIKRQLQK